MMKRTNEKIKKALENKRLCQWELADMLGVSESTVTRLLRHELPEEKKKEILDLIKSA